MRTPHSSHQCILGVLVALLTVSGSVSAQETDGNALRFTSTPSDIGPVEIATAWTNVRFDLPTATGGALVTCDKDPGSSFPIGTTKVTCTAKDSSSNTTTTSFKVIVVYTGVPVIRLPTVATTYNNGKPAAVRFVRPMATDQLQSLIPVTCTHWSGQTFPVGTTVVTCSATNIAGNTATASFTVKVA